MNNITLSILLVVIGLIFGALLTVLVVLLRNKSLKKEREEQLLKMQKEAEKSRRDMILEAKEESHRLKMELDKEIKEKKGLLSWGIRCIEF